MKQCCRLQEKLKHWGREHKKGGGGGGDERKNKKEGVWTVFRVLNKTRNVTFMKERKYEFVFLK